MSTTIKYPRRVFVRSLLRSVGRVLLNLLAYPRISGIKRIPDKGPLIMIGNHTGALEVVLMGAYSPSQVEFMGAMEMPWKGWMKSVIQLYGLIPVYRGYTTFETMRMALEVLKQGGVLGIFPEGGFWERGNQKIQPGAAWLSFKSGAPVLPIGFGDTRGKMAEAFKGKKPDLEMNVGKPLPPVKLDQSISKKESLQAAAKEIMNQVWELVPEEEKQKMKLMPEDEIFSFHVKVFKQSGERVPIPAELAIEDGSWISRFAHRPNLIDSIRDYIFIPVQVLKELDKRPPAEEIFNAADSMLEYVETENPQYFNYRYGYQDGRAFHKSFLQLRDLMSWIMEKDYKVEAEVCYEFTDPISGEYNVLRIPGEIEQW